MNCPFISSRISKGSTNGAICQRPSTSVPTTSVSHSMPGWPMPMRNMWSRVCATPLLLCDSEIQERKAMKVIITGGSGFIGSHVVDEVMALGHEVVIYDLEAPHYGQQCAFVRGDTRDIDRMVQTARGAEIIYNIAAEA